MNSLRARLFTGFCALVIIFAALSAWFSISVLNRRVVEEAQNRVRLDLRSAWAVYEGKLGELKAVVELAASKRSVETMCSRQDWRDGDAIDRLERIRIAFGFDFLSVVSPDGTVVVRTGSSRSPGDDRANDPAVARALAGESVGGTELWDPVELEREAEGLAARAAIPLTETPRARATTRAEEDRGMVMIAAAPIRDGGRIRGALYAGVLVNHNNGLITDIHDVLYGDEAHEGMSVGSATVFLNDTRITSTIRRADGRPAVGTRVSAEVAERVLGAGMPWTDRAFVVNDWYITAYEPLRDLTGRSIGMLYVGILEGPYRALARSTVWRYLGLTLAVMVVSLAVAYVLAARLSRPLRRLSRAAEQLRRGEYPETVPDDRTSAETGALVAAFNEMADALREREASLAETNRHLSTVNRNYMEMLGFVSHELKSPMAAMMNYTFLLRNEMIGPMTDKQKQAANVLDSTVQRMTEMVRHYLNLSRIEKDELDPVPTAFAVLPEVIEPVLETHEAGLAAHDMKVGMQLSGEDRLYADVGMVREVFDNLVSNAIKYGRPGGTIIVSAAPEGDFLRFAVRNEGDGLSPEKMQSLFGKFARLQEKGDNRKGTGLGLFITKHIVEAHGGTISAASEIGRWVEFSFTLPGDTGAASRGA